MADVLLQRICSRANNDSHSSKESDKWYTPTNIVDLVNQVLGEIDLDLCADDGRHIRASQHYTAEADGLSQEWRGRVFMNPPYSCPGKWVAKLQAEIEAGRATEAIALLPAYDELISKLAIAPESLIPQVELPLDSGSEKDFSGQPGQVLKTVQFDSDEIQFVNEGYKAMKTFQFSETTRISEQIAQLQKQLDQLTASLQPYRECEQKAEELRLAVAEYGHEMTAKGIPQNDILNWAKSLYSAASGTEFVVSDNSVIAAQNQVIAELKAELEKAKKHRDEALAKITNMTAAQLRVAENLKSLRDENTKLKNFAAQTDTAAIEILQKENASLITRIKELEAPSKQTNFKVGDIVQYKNGEIGKVFHIIPDSHNYGTVQVQLENKMVEIPVRDLVLCASDALNENVQDEDRQAYTKILTKDDIVQTDTGEVGTVTGFAYGNVIVKLVNGEFNFRREQLKWISTKAQAPQFHNFHPGDRDDEGQYEKAASHPDKELIEFVVARDRGREFIERIRSKAGMNNVTWPIISKVCLGSLHAFEEINLAATTKYQKELVEKLPTLMADYILETGDITDMQWLDETFKSKVEALLEAKKQHPYHSNDWVRNLETGEIWQVRSFDGEWLSVKQQNKIASLHKSEVELIKREAA